MRCFMWCIETVWWKPSSCKLKQRSLESDLEAQDATKWHKRSLIDELETSWVDPLSQSSADGVCLRAIKVGVIGVFRVEILNRCAPLVCLFLIVKHFSVFLSEFKNWCFIFPSNSESQDLGNGSLCCFFLQNNITHSSGQKSPFSQEKL